ncbi:MAG: hypothetical protein AB7L13_17775 [Acidimicrobiia bacterium]
MSDATDGTVPVEVISGELVDRTNRTLGPVGGLRSIRSLPAESIRAAGELYDSVIAKVLIAPDSVTSRTELEDRLEHLAEQTTMTNGALATGALAIVTRIGRRLPLKRIPSAVAVTGTLAVGGSIRAGVLELRAIASYLVDRAAREGVVLDRAAVGRLTLELYLNPGRQPAPSPRRTRRIARLLWHWVRRAGVMPLIGGKRDDKRATRIAGAAERLDLTA